MKYRAGVIGCGRIGFEFDKDPKRRYIATHTGAYNYVKDIDLAAVCDIDKKRLKGCMDRWNIPEGYSDLKEMLRKENLDILSICTLPSTHYPILKEAVKYPLKAIFCEKPIAENKKNAEKMVKLCKEKNIILQIDHQRRFDPLHVDLREFIKSKEVGDVQQVNVYYTAGVNNTGSHMFDLLSFFFGEADWVEGFFSKNISHKKNDPNIDGFMRFKSGVFASFQACDVNKYLILELNCFFGKGRVVLKSSGFGVDFYKVGDSKLFSGYKELYRSRVPFRTNYKRDFMVNAVEHLIKCINNKKESASSGDDGIKALGLIEACISSAKNNGKRKFLN
jgi:predicted dehydrogenase|tara:strand:+ start:1430 stop:2431 length:1002 start_codon:yes stop_codon:yes gene_type:complete